MQKIITLLAILACASAFFLIYKKDQQRKEGLLWHDNAVKNINQFLMTSYDK